MAELDGVTPSIPALQKQRPVDLREFKARLVFLEKFPASQGYSVRPCVKLTKQFKENWRTLSLQILAVSLVTLTF